MCPYEENKEFHNIPVERKKIGKVLHRAGEWYDNKTKCSPFDIIEGYVLETQYNDVIESQKHLLESNSNLVQKCQDLKDGKDIEAKPEEYLNLMLDIKRIEKVIRRLDKRSRKSKDDDVTVRCANAIGLLEGKKLLLIQAVTHVKK